MTNLPAAFAAAASPAQAATLSRVRDLAMRRSQRVALVGGLVRDLLLGRPPGDMDFVVERTSVSAKPADAIEFAQALVNTHGGELTIHARFRTATWHGEHGALDFATARLERYAKPAALPEVLPTTLEEDLKRRDVTCNAIAWEINTNVMLDPFHGVADMQHRVLHALHPQSFVDDPTRMFRLARYAGRLGFDIGRDTMQWLSSGLQHVASLSGERIRYDLELIFDEPNAGDMLALLADWQVFRAMGVSVPDAASLRERMQRLEARGADWDIARMGADHAAMRRALGWGVLIYNAGQLGIARWLGWIPFDKRLRDCLVSLGPLASIDRQLFTGPASRSSRLLQPFDGMALLIAHVLGNDVLKATAMHSEWHQWRQVRPMLTGDDLNAMQIAAGPEFKQLLDALRDARLDGDVRTRADEVALLKRLRENS